MPDSQTDGPGPNSEQPSLSDRLAQAEADRDRLQAELDARSNESVESWLAVVGTESRILGQMHATLSWRVTKPLRFARRVQLKIAQVGVARVSQLAVADLRRRFIGRRR